MVESASHMAHCPTHFAPTGASGIFKRARAAQPRRATWALCAQLWLLGKARWTFLSGQLLLRVLEFSIHERVSISRRSRNLHSGAAVRFRNVLRGDCITHGTACGRLCLPLPLPHSTFLLGRCGLSRGSRTRCRLCRLAFGCLCRRGRGAAHEEIEKCFRLGRGLLQRLGVDGGGILSV